MGWEGGYHFGGKREGREWRTIFIFAGGWKEMYTLHADVDFVLFFPFDIGAKGVSGRGASLMDGKKEEERPRNTLASRLDTTNSRSLTAGSCHVCAAECIIYFGLYEIFGEAICI